MSDESRGGDETRHRYQTHSEWHTDSKFVGLLKVGYQIIMEPKAAGWIRIKQMIWGAGQHIMDKETRCALVRFIEIMEQGHHIE